MDYDELAPHALKGLTLAEAFSLADGRLAEEIGRLERMTSLEHLPFL